MLVREGVVQRMKLDRGKGIEVVWPIAQTLQDAVRLAGHLGGDDAVAAARIGSVAGESIEKHVKLAIAEGCIGVCCVSGWKAGGEPRWKWRFFDT